VGTTGVAPRQAPGDLRHITEGRSTFTEVARETAPGGWPEPRRAPFGAQVDELERACERQVRELTGPRLCEPECSTLERPTEANLGVRLRGQERMFPWLGTGVATS
jgi:hypothetical protein